MQVDNFVSIAVELQIYAEFHNGNTQQPPSMASAPARFLAWIHISVLAIDWKEYFPWSKNKQKILLSDRAKILLKAGDASHICHHWFVVPVLFIWWFSYKGYKLESWSELPSLSDRKKLIVQTSTDLSFPGLERFTASENMHDTWDFCTREFYWLE